MSIKFILVANHVTLIYFSFYFKYNGVHVFLMNIVKNGDIPFSGKGLKIIGNKLKKLLRYAILVIYSFSRCPKKNPSALDIIWGIFECFPWIPVTFPFQWNAQYLLSLLPWGRLRTRQLGRDNSGCSDTWGALGDRAGCGSGPPCVPERKEEKCCQPPGSRWHRHTRGAVRGQPAQVAWPPASVTHVLLMRLKCMCVC